MEACGEPPLNQGAVKNRSLPSSPSLNPGSPGRQLPPALGPRSCSHTSAGAAHPRLCFRAWHGRRSSWHLAPKQPEHCVRERQSPGDTLHLPGDRYSVALKTRLPKASSAQAGHIASGKAVLAVGPRGGAAGHSGGPCKLPRPEGLPALLLAGVSASC